MVSRGWRMGSCKTKMKFISITIIVVLILAAFPVIIIPKGFCDLTNPSILVNHDPIHINGNNQFTSANGVVRGDGSKSNPYIIENYDITLGVTPKASINIMNTRSNYTIRGCNLIGPAATPSYGIYLVNSTYGRIINNMITATNPY